MAAQRRAYVVLGGGGFIGTNLCRRLAERGHRVRAFGRRCLFPEALSGIEWCQGDFADTDLVGEVVKSADTVFHLVHATMPQAAELNPAADLTQNVVPSIGLMQQCGSRGVGRLVFMSSGGTVYGRARQIPTPETAPTDPISAYGVSKLATEKYLGLYAHSHGLDFRVLRVTNPFGPFQVALKNQGVIAALVARGLSGEPMDIWGDGSVVRDFVFVGDLVDALEHAADDRSTERVFNIGGGQGRSLREVIAAIERLLGFRLDIRWKPGRPLDVPVSVVAIDRAKSVLGWAPQTPFETGLELTIDWARRTRPTLAELVR